MPSVEIVCRELEWLQCENHLRKQDVRNLENACNRFRSDCERLHANVVNLESERDAARQELADTRADRDNLIQQRNAVMHERDENARLVEELHATIRRLQINQSTDTAAIEEKTRPAFESITRYAMEEFLHADEESKSRQATRDEERKNRWQFSKTDLLQLEINRLKAAFEVLITQMNSTSGFDPAVLRARLAGEQ